MTDKSKDSAGIENRRAEFKRNMDLESFLFSLNDTLLPSEDMLRAQFTEPEKPILLLVGPMRSGTTLMMQWLAQTGLVAYPSNLMSRFFKAPLVGARIQQLLTDERYQFRDEFADFTPNLNFKSENGKTPGVLAPNEYWYFWNQMIASDKADCWTGAELEKALNVPRLLATLHGLTEIFEKPFATKAMKFNYAIPYLHSLSSKFIFMHIHRDPVRNMVSTLSARERQFGNLEGWYSFRVPEYDALKDMSPQEQVAGQVHSLNKATREGLAAIPSDNVIDCPYESFCANPGDFHDRLRDKLALAAAGTYQGPEQFQPSGFRNTYGSEAELQAIYNRVCRMIDE